MEPPPHAHKQEAIGARYLPCNLELLGPLHPLVEDSGSKHHAKYGCWSQSTTLGVSALRQTLFHISTVRVEGTQTEGMSMVLYQCRDL